MENHFIDFFFGILIPATLVANYQVPQPRVVHGRYAEPDQYPYVVSLERPLEGFLALHRICTGSLVTDQWVLTAAHCLTDEIQVVRYGNMTAPRLQATFKKILKMVPHPGYFLVEFDEIEFGSNDIGMVLVEKLTINTFAAISAEDYKTLVGCSVTYAGFGYTVEKDLKYISKMNEVEKRSIIAQILKDQMRPLQIGEGVLHNKEATYMIKPTLYVSPKCVNMGQTANYGDSGGPMFYRDKVIAVCSGGSLYNPDRRSEMYGAYTPVSPFVQWIHDIVSASL